MSKDVSPEELVKYLINIWGKEISSDELQEIDGAKIKSLINTIEVEANRIEELKNELTKDVVKREIDLLRFICEDIWSVRIEKIIAALLNGDTINLENLLLHEKKILSMIKSMISINPLKNISEYVSDENLDNVVDEEIKVRKKDVEYILLLASDNVPMFMGLDGVIYRGIYKGDIVMIPRINYNYFKKTMFTSLN